MKKKAGLKLSTFNSVEDILRDYPLYPKWINEREQEIFAPMKELDENIGGSRSGYTSNITERIASSLIEDIRLKELRREYEAVRVALGECEENALKIVQLYYFDKPRLKTWSGIALEIGYSERHCRRLRNGIVKRIADLLGRV